MAEVIEVRPQHDDAGANLRVRALQPPDHVGARFVFGDQFDDQICCVLSLEQGLADLTFECGDDQTGISGLLGRKLR